MMKPLPRKITFILSVILHSLLLLSLFYFSRHPNDPPTGTSLVLNVHLTMNGMMSKKTNIVKKQLLKDKSNAEKKTLDHAKNYFSKETKKQLVSSFQTKGNLNNLMILLHNLISQQQHYPQTALILEQQGDIEVGFMLSPNGEIRNIKLLHSSHYPSLDDAALHTLEAISPVPNAASYIQTEKSMSVWVHFKFH